MTLVANVFQNDLAVRLELEELEHEADKVRRRARSARDGRAAAAADRAELGRLVEEARGGEAEAVLLPVDGVVDAGAQDLLDEVLLVMFLVWFFVFWGRDG